MDFNFGDISKLAGSISTIVQSGAPVVSKLLSAVGVGGGGIGAGYVPPAKLPPAGAGDRGGNTTHGGGGLMAYLPWLLGGALVLSMMKRGR